MFEERPKRLQDVIQAGLILVLTVLLLVVGSTSIGYMFQAERNQYKYELLEEEYNRQLKTIDADLKLRIDRVREVSESDSYTKDRRIRILEERADALERELALQKQELARLK